MTVAELLTKYHLLYDNCRFELQDGDPWLPVIEQLSSFIMGSGIQVAQVKEKFGGLRFYHKGCNNYIQGAIDFAASLCEGTGTFRIPDDKRIY